MRKLVCHHSSVRGISNLQTSYSNRRAYLSLAVDLMAQTKYTFYFEMRSVSDAMVANAALKCAISGM